MVNGLEIPQEQRFGFGANWQRFLHCLNEERISMAKAGLIKMLGSDTLAGKTFLDIGSGSGLFSLAARMLGATVRSFDYDPKSVLCTRELKNRYFPEDRNWIIEEGSVLDKAYLDKVGKYDVVYSWGVLHHTGDMWTALDNIAGNVKSNGKLWIAIYNDQGWISRYWSMVKKSYNSNLLLRALVVSWHFPYLYCLRILARALTGRLQYERGMSYWHDMIDWLGGYPFEVATPEQIKNFYEARGFKLSRVKTCGQRMGCNEFVLVKADRTIAE